MEQLVSSVQSGGEKLVASLLEVGTESTTAADQLQNNFVAASTGVQASLQSLIGVQSEYTASTANLVSAGQGVAAAEEQVASAETLLEEVRAATVGSSNELVVAAKLLQDARIQLS